MKVIIAESLYGSDSTVRPLIDMEWEIFVLVAKFHQFMTYESFESGFPSLSRSNQYHLLHSIKRWGLILRYGILSAHPDTRHSSVVSEIDSGKKLHSEDIESAEQTISSQIKAVEEEIPRNKKEFFLFSIETIVLGCCKKMRVLEQSEYEELSIEFTHEQASTVPAESSKKTSDDRINRLSVYETDIEEFSCFLESQELLHQLKENSLLYDLSAFWEAYRSLEPFLISRTGDEVLFLDIRFM
jgi:hypothetical protein